MKLFKKSLLLFLLLTLVTMGISVAIAAPRAQSVLLDATSVLIDLANEKSIQLTGSVLPEGASQLIEWKSSNTGIVTVTSKGLVTAKKTGTAYIYARPKGISTITRCKVTVQDSLSPVSLVVNPATKKIYVGDTFTVLTIVSPSTAVQTLAWKSSKSSVASVDANGLVTARKAGTAVISVRSTRNAALIKNIRVTVVKRPAPTKILLTPDTKVMNIRSTLQLTADPQPSVAAQGVKWSTSNKKVATVTSSGKVTALSEGTVKITAYSSVKSSVKTVRTITVQDPYTLKKLAINGTADILLGIGESRELTYDKLPVTATTEIVWKSSSSAVSVSDSGKITAKSSGLAIIAVQSADGKVSSKVRVGVIDTNLATTEPARNTSMSGLNSNMNKIEAIHDSAEKNIANQVSIGALTSTSAAKRKAAIDRAFTMYEFPWTTPVEQKYWSTDKPSSAYEAGSMYYGMPYIQRSRSGNSSNRRFNMQKAVTEGYFVKSGAYYTMSPTKKLSGFYVGSDCSSFVSMSIWGVNHPASYFKTGDIANSSYYVTVKSPTAMLPGDVLVKSNDHVVMFLYYTNSARTHMMIIEQGGGQEPNTVASRHKCVKDYTSSGYVIRRAKAY